MTENMRDDLEEWRSGVVGRMTPKWGEVCFADGSAVRFTPMDCYCDGTAYYHIVKGDQARVRVRDGAVSSPNTHRWTHPLKD